MIPSLDTHALRRQHALARLSAGSPLAPTTMAFEVCPQGCCARDVIRWSDGELTYGPWRSAEEYERGAGAETIPLFGDSQ